MTKQLKPGQLCTVCKRLYRAKKAIIPETCTGCDLLNDSRRCSYVQCNIYGVILQEVKIKKEKLHA